MWPELGLPLAATAQGALPAVLLQSVGDRLPLHVRSVIGATVAQWMHVVDHVTWAGAAAQAGGRAGRFAHERRALGGGARSRLSAQHAKGERSNYGWSDLSHPATRLTANTKTPSTAKPVP